MLLSCSTTKNIPDGDQLFIGLTKIEYKQDTVQQQHEQDSVRQQREHFVKTQEEVEAALATAPNGAFFGKIGRAHV